MRDVSSLWEKRISCSTSAGSADVEPRNVRIPEQYGGWKRGERCCAVRVVEDRAVPLPGQDELIHHGRAECVRFIQLALPLRLNAGDIEKRIDRVCIGRLIAFIVKNAQKHAIILPGVVINAAGILRFGCQVVIGRLEKRRASDPWSEAREPVAP